MSTKRDADAGADAAEADEEELDLDLASATVDGLTRDGDAEGLFLLAKAARSGSHGRTKDMATAFAAYRAAGDLGHADADYAAALFYLTGTGTEKDPKEAAARLRRSADKGNVDAKVTLGNFYELGVHYTKDAEKADVWYRNAARAAGIQDPPGSKGHVRALAQLGSVRHAELFAEDPEATTDEIDTARKKARVRGGSREGRLETGAMKAISSPEIAPTDGARPAADRVSKPGGAPRASNPGASGAVAKAGSVPDPKEVDPEKARRARLAELEKKAKRPSKLTGKAGLGAFLYSLLFTATALGAAFAADAGAKELVSHGKAVPLFGARLDLVFPVLLGVVALLPQLLVYKAVTVARSVLAGAFAFGVGWVLYGTGKLALGDARLSQAIAFAGAAFLSTLLVQGLFGGSKATEKA